MQGKQPTRKRGRPPKGEVTDKRATLSTRITSELREALDIACRKNDRSLSQEIELRLLRSFDRDASIEEMYGSRENYALVRMIIMAMNTVEAVTGRSWKKDPYTFVQCKKAILGVVRPFRPDGSAEPPADLRAPEELDPSDLGGAAAAGVLTQVVLADPDKPPLPQKGVFYSNEAMTSARIHKDLGKLEEKLK